MHWETVGWLNVIGPTHIPSTVIKIKVSNSIGRHQAENKMENTKEKYQCDKSNQYVSVNATNLKSIDYNIIRFFTI